MPIDARQIGGLVRISVGAAWLLEVRAAAGDDFVAVSPTDDPEYRDAFRYYADEDEFPIVPFYTANQADNDEAAGDFGAENGRLGAQIDRPSDSAAGAIKRGDLPGVLGGEVGLSRAQRSQSANLAACLRGGDVCDRLQLRLRHRR